MVALLDFAHFAFFPDGVQNHHSVNRRVHLHQCGIFLGVKHGLTRSVTLYLHYANGRLGGPPLQIECLSKLLQRGFRFLQFLLSLFGVNSRSNFDLLHLKLGLFKIALSLVQFGFVLRTSSVLFGLLLFDLVEDFVVFRLFVEEILNLRLPIELDQDIAALDAASCGNQFRDSERASLLP